MRSSAKNRSEKCDQKPSVKNKTPVKLRLLTKPLCRADPKISGRF